MSVSVIKETATTEIYTLALHDALPIYAGAEWPRVAGSDRSAPRVRADRLHHRPQRCPNVPGRDEERSGDRKSTRLNSSHANISYAVFCLKKTTYFSHIFRSQTTTPALH